MSDRHDITFERIRVIKIGGSLLDAPERLSVVLDGIAESSDPVILVHGGGPQADRLAERMGHPATMRDGRRVTDAGTLEIVTMVYAGLNNKGVVARLAARGVDAVGVSGADLRLLRAERRPVGDVDYGFVGDVTHGALRVDRILQLLAQGITPLFSALTWDGAGGLLNTNADTIAATIAAALSTSNELSEVAIDLLMIMDAPGLLADLEDPASLLGDATPEMIAAMKEAGTLVGGIVPKVDNGCMALRHGVRSVRIGRETMMTDDAAGTTLRTDERPGDVISFEKVDPAFKGVDLLRRLIAMPSFSGEEEETAALISSFLQHHGYRAERCGNNVWSRGTEKNGRPTLLLNSHHDTVRPSSGYTRSPFDPAIEDGRLYGLGSNDAGGPLVALLQTFVELGRKDDLPYNLLFVASAEEETSGRGGIGMVLPELGAIDCGIVGEPTSLQVAVAEKGLMVLDCTARGTSGHAARDEGENALYRALDDIEWFRTYRFEEVSDTLGPVRMTVTVIDAGSAHNVVPNRCTFTVDVRTTDMVDNGKALEVIRSHVSSEVVPRSMRLNASGISESHPLVRSVERLGIPTYGSPTLSDQAQMPFPTIKFGPGDSARSHTADEYIVVADIAKAVTFITEIIEGAG